MTISVVGGAVAANNSTTINVPSGTHAGDLMLLYGFSSANGVGNPTAPAGWTTLSAGNNGAAMSQVVAYKIASASEPASYAFTAGSGSTFNDGSIVTMRSPYPLLAHAVSSATVLTATSLTLPALQTQQGGELLWLLMDTSLDQVVTFPVGFTTLASATDTVNGGQSVAYAPWGASGDTGAQRCTVPSSDNLVGFFVLVREVVPVYPSVTAPGWLFPTVAVPSTGTAWNQSLGPDAHSGLDTRLSQFGKSLSTEFTSALDGILKQGTKPLLDAHSGLDSLVWTLLRSLLDSFSETDARSLFTGKQVNLGPDTQSGQDILVRQVQKALGDAFSAVDGYAKAANKSLLDSFSVLDSLAKLTTKPTLDTHSALDVFLWNATKALTDGWSGVDLFSRVWTAHLTLQDWVSEVETSTRQSVKSLFDQLSETDQLTAIRGLVLKLLDAASLTDVVLLPTVVHPRGQAALAMVLSMLAAVLGTQVSFPVGVLTTSASLASGVLSQTLTNF